MSCYEWEQGTIKIPADQWSSFKKSLTETYNNKQQWRYKKALQVYEQLMADSKGKRKYDFGSKIRELVCVYNSGLDYPDQYDDYRSIERALLPVNKSGKPKKPKAKDFPANTNRSDTFPPYITINNKNRTVTWYVEENNRAVDSARGTYMGVAFFKLLDSVNWKRGSGGKIVGNDEYNQEDRDTGGGGNYVTAQYPKPTGFSDKYTMSYSGGKVYA